MQAAWGHAPARQASLQWRGAGAPPRPPSCPAQRKASTLRHQYLCARERTKKSWRLLAAAVCKAGAVIDSHGPV
jgi:hypothetical protein